MQCEKTGLREVRCESRTCFSSLPPGRDASGSPEETLVPLCSTKMGNRKRLQWGGEGEGSTRECLVGPVVVGGPTDHESQEELRRPDGTQVPQSWPVWVRAAV